ncbi:ribonuclease H1 isoform X1 [Nasonia vitripennis]|uniref:Ribonuclease H1 n=1 Tax=Nasonia vitripennis TaxID=7425 RepID=A0A7M7J168_NASVI|nr:ribonuclease H1 isoform X1 [Nasonia vitripennis]
MSKLFFSLFHGRTFQFSVVSDFLGGIMSYYAVAKGRNPGIYSTWDECKAQVHKFPGPKYKKFGSESEAESFIKANSGTTSSYPQTSGSIKSSSFLTQKTFALGKICASPASSTTLKRVLSTASDSDSDLENVKHKRIKRDNSTAQNKDGFSIDSNGYTEVYTDGACSSNGRRNAKAGIGVWFSERNAYNVSQPVDGRATNNIAEIQAVTIAASQAQKAGIKKLKINTDSQFLISCITQWMPKWKKCGWQTSTGKPVINKTELIEMEKALAPLQVSWNHVRGHVGIHGNEMADRLARSGAERYGITIQLVLVLKCLKFSFFAESEEIFA